MTFLITQARLLCDKWLIGWTFWLVLPFFLDWYSLKSVDSEAVLGHSFIVFLRAWTGRGDLDVHYFFVCFASLNLIHSMAAMRHVLRLLIRRCQFIRTQFCLDAYSTPCFLILRKQDNFRATHPCSWLVLAYRRLTLSQKRATSLSP